MADGRVKSHDGSIAGRQLGGRQLGADAGELLDADWARRYGVSPGEFEDLVAAGVPVAAPCAARSKLTPAGVALLDAAIVDRAALASLASGAFSGALAHEADASLAGARAVRAALASSSAVPAVPSRACGPARFRVTPLRFFAAAAVVAVVATGTISSVLLEQTGYPDRGPRSVQGRTVLAAVPSDWVPRIAVLSPAAEPLPVVSGSAETAGVVRAIGPGIAEPLVGGARMLELASAGRLAFVVEGVSAQVAASAADPAFDLGVLGAFSGGRFPLLREASPEALEAALAGMVHAFGAKAVWVAELATPSPWSPAAGAGAVPSGSQGVVLEVRVVPSR